VFGLSFGELVVLLLVAVVVLGPKEMPRYLRKAGQLAGQLRRMAYDMRAKSGIDEVLRSEGIGSDIAEIRRLATFARGELGSIMTDLRSTANGAAVRDVPASPYAQTQTPYPAQGPQPTAPVRPPAPVPMVAASSVVEIDRAREYPTAGADSYGALPEGSRVYEGELAKSEPGELAKSQGELAKSEPEGTSDADRASPASEAP
jgi:sec-independent protein translocase protein TatB